MLQAALIVTRFLHYAATLALFGVALFPLYALAASAAPQSRDRAIRLSRVVLALCTVLAAVSGIAWFAFTVATMAGDASQSLNPALWRTVLQSTAFGPLWAGRLLLVIFAGLLLSSWPRGMSLRMLPLVAALALASLAGTGHAQSHEGWLRTVHEIIDAFHLLAAGMWLGGLLPLGFVLAGRQGHGEVKPIAVVLQRFSAVAIVAVGILAASGLLNAWLLVGHPSALITTGYGLALSVKLLLFAAMLVLAAVNRFWISPRLDIPKTAPALLRRLSVNVALEQLLGLGVIGAVSVLGTLPPPGMS